MMRELLPMGLILLMILVGFYYHSKLPSQIPTHFDFKGVPDDWMPKNVALSLIPGSAIIFYTILTIIGLSTPKVFAWKTLMLLFFASLHISTIYYALGKVRSIFTLIIPALILFSLYILWLIIRYTAFCQRLMRKG